MVKPSVLLHVLPALHRHGRVIPLHLHFSSATVLQELLSAVPDVTDVTGSSSILFLFSTLTISKVNAMLKPVAIKCCIKMNTTCLVQHQLYDIGPFCIPCRKLFAGSKIDQNPKECFEFCLCFGMCPVDIKLGIVYL